MNSFISFNVSYKLNSNTSNPGNMFINGVFRVSSKIISAPNEIINTIKYEKNLLLLVFLTILDLLSVSLMAVNSGFAFLFSSTVCFI